MPKPRQSQAKRSFSRKQRYVSVELRSIMPSKYTAHKRSNLRRFEKKVMGSWNLNVKKDE